MWGTCLKSGKGVAGVKVVGCNFQFWLQSSNFCPHPHLLQEQCSCVRSTQGAVSAAFASMEVGSSFFWLSMKIKFFCDLGWYVGDASFCPGVHIRTKWDPMGGRA
jgi:hypothetical protein